MSAAALDARRARRGFTLIEVVLAMGILAMGAAAVLGMLTFGAALTRTAQLRAAAAQAVDAVNSDLDQVLFPYSNGAVGEPIAIAERPVPGAPDVVYSARAVQNPDDAREYRIDVELSWKSAGVKRAKSYSILRLREISFGERLRRELVEGGGGARPASANPGGAATRSDPATPDGGDNP